MNNRLSRRLLMKRLLPALTFRVLLTWTLCPSSKRASRALCSTSIWASKSGTNLRTKRILMDLASKRLFSQDAKIQTLELEFMLEVLNHTKLSQLFSIQSSKTITSISFREATLATWMLLSSLHLPSHLRMLPWSNLPVLEWVVTWRISLSDQELPRNRETPLSRKLSRLAIASLGN